LHSPRVAVVVGSNRPQRICEVIARWTLDVARQGSALTYALVDLAEIDLPFLDEPRMPALGGYVHDHTKRWSALVQSFDAYVFVFPQYNWGYPAPLKNALDFLYVEWRAKPAGLVTYGTRGGARGAAQLRSVLEGLHMLALDHGVEIAIADSDVDDAGQLLHADATLAPYVQSVRAMDAELSDVLLDNAEV
jgi:NAD(P)H-dependent FMN reductase